MIVCGLLTSVCVNYTAINAYYDGLDVALLTDCCGDLTLERHQNFLKLNDCLYDYISLDDFEKS